MIASNIPTLPANLTIALIQRDNKFPEAVIRQGERQVATRLAVAAYSRYTPPPEHPGAIGPPPHADLDPLRWPYRSGFTCSDCDPMNPNDRADVVPYMPHRIPSPTDREIHQKYASPATDQIDRLIDVYV